MTGRGDNKIMRPSNKPAVTIGLTLSTPSPTITPSSTLTLALTARILKTPHPALPVTLTAYQNPFARIPTNPSYVAMRCVAPKESGGKSININPCAQPRAHRGMFGKRVNLKEWMEFVTIPSLTSGQTVTIQHTVSADAVEKAEVVCGEVYRAVLTDRSLGTHWWRFGEMPKGGIGLWLRERAEDEEEEDEGEEEEDGEEESGEKLSKLSLVELDRGEEPHSLALVIESGEVDFEVV